MRPDKLNIQYKILDIIFLYLLGYKQKVVRVQYETFCSYCNWLRLQKLRCVRIQKLDGASSRQWIVLTCLNQRAIQNHLKHFFISYYQGKIQANNYKLNWIEWRYFLEKEVIWRLQGGKKLVFSFSGSGNILTHGSESCAFFCACRYVSALLLHDTKDVMGISFDKKTNCAYVTYRTTYKQGKHLLLARFGALIYGWQTRPGVRWALYKGHHIQFHSAYSKQKRLLDLLLDANLKISLACAVKQLNINTTSKEKEKARLFDIASHLRQKAVQACRGTKDKVTFEISVAGDYIQMIESLH